MHFRVIGLFLYQLITKIPLPPLGYKNQNKTARSVCVQEQSAHMEIGHQFIKS